MSWFTTLARSLAIATITAAMAPWADAAPLDIRVAAEAPGSIRFTVEVPDLRIERGGAQGWSTVNLPGYADRGRAGGPALPERIVVVAVPAEGQVTVSGVPSLAEHHEAVRLGPGEWIREGVPGGEPPAPVARLVDVSWMRNQRVARVAIAPATYDEGNRRVLLWRRVDVVVTTSPTGEAGPPADRADAFEGVYRSALVNYEQGRRWRRSVASAAQMAAAVPDTTVFAGRNWVRVSIPASGFYKVEFGQVRNTALFRDPDSGVSDTSTSLDSLRLFTWPGVPVLPEDSYCDSCDYREVAVGFVENGNGMFSNNRDFLYFYALGPNDWADRYDPARPDTDYVNHPYETRNYVYLTVARPGIPIGGIPRRITGASGAFADTTGLATPGTFVRRRHLEVDTDSEYWPDAAPFGADDQSEFRRFNIGWEKFFWASVTRNSGAFEATLDLPGLDPGAAVRFRARVWGLTRLFPGFFPNVPHKSPGIPDHKLDVSVGATALPRLEWNGISPQTVDVPVPGLAESGNRVTIGVTPFDDPNPAFNPRVDVTGVAWFQAHYPSRFVAVEDALEFESEPSGGTWLYKISPFTLDPTTPPRVFDVTDPLQPVEILDVDYRPLSPGSHELRFLRTESGRRRYLVFPDAATRSAIVRPPNPDVVEARASSLDNLRSGPEADYLLIYYDGFEAAADSLLAWRRLRLPLSDLAADTVIQGPYRTYKVPISALYDQFSGGRTDPAAIRNFLRAAFFNWARRPAFVTLLGDASRDFKNLSGLAPAGQPGTLVPSYENNFDSDVNRQFATDDWLFNVDDPTTVRPDFFGGRIPAGDPAAALAYVRDKLLPYERNAPPGEWMANVLLIADDNEQGANVDVLGWLHLDQTARLDREGLPPEFDRTYVYLHTYADGQGETKPGARDEILRTLDRGALLMNYIGHGSPFKISDESVFSTVEGASLANQRRPTVFVAASCDVGKFNDPTVQSLGELLVLSPRGGAVAVISATEVAFSNQNAALNLNLYRELFRRDGGGSRSASIAEALNVAKISGIQNNQKYQVMGDAAVHLEIPRAWAELDFTDATGTPVSDLQRGVPQRLAGQVVERPGGPPLALDGLARLLIEDSAPVDTVPGCAPFDCVTFPFRAAPLFRGDVQIRGGRFATDFVIPLEARLGGRARARAYIELAGGAVYVDGVGSDTFRVVSGGAPGSDRDPPRIGLGFVGGSTTVRPDAVLRVDLNDPSGILITGRTPQNGIIVTLDEDSNQRFDITSGFRYAANSYQSGTALFTLPGLAPGAHRVRVSAADNLAAGLGSADHRTSATLDFVVADAPTLEVTRALLYPNPVRSRGPGAGGQFVVDAPGDSVNALLRIYTVAGRLVRTLEFRGGQTQVQIGWDGRDAEGAPLAQGTYIFKVQVYPRDAEGGSEGGRRAEAVGRFVVLEGG